MNPGFNRAWVARASCADRALGVLVTDAGWLQGVASGELIELYNGSGG
jgi:hypothetical protein